MLKHTLSYLMLSLLAFVNINAQQVNGNTICGQNAVKIYYTKHGIICATTQEEPALKHLSIEPNIVNKILSDSLLIPMTPTSSSNGQTVAQLVEQQQQQQQVETSSQPLQTQESQNQYQVQYVPDNFMFASAFNTPVRVPFNQVQHQLYSSANPSNPSFHQLQASPSHTVNYFYPDSQENMFASQSRRFTRQVAIPQVSITPVAPYSSSPTNNQFVVPQIQYGFKPVSAQTMSGLQGNRKLITRYRAVTPNWSHDSRQPRFETLQSENEKDLPPAEPEPQIVTAPPHLAEGFDGVRKPDNDVLEGRKKEVSFRGMQIIRVPKGVNIAFSGPLSASFGTRGNDERFVVRDNGRSGSGKKDEDKEEMTPQNSEINMSVSERQRDTNTYMYGTRIASFRKATN